MDHSIYLASLDQSTTTTKFSIYHQDGTLVEKELVFHEQISKQENWLEHNPGEIIENVNKAISAVMDRMKLKEDFNAR
jgi:glycerol kinase